MLDIPVVEARARAAIQTAGFPLQSYSGQAMLEVISGLPREELFSASEQTLHDTAVGVLAMAGRRAVRLFLRPDPYRRFISALVYLPRDRYTTESRLAMAEVLQRRLGGRSVEDTARVSESTLALVQFTVHTARDAVGFDDDIDVAALQDELTEVVRTWDDRLLAAARHRRAGARCCRGVRRVQGGRRPPARGRGPAPTSPRCADPATSTSGSTRPPTPRTNAG